MMSAPSTRVGGFLKDELRLVGAFRGSTFFPTHGKVDVACGNRPGNTVMYLDDYVVVSSFMSTSYLHAFLSAPLLEYLSSLILSTAVQALFTAFNRLFMLYHYNSLLLSLPSSLHKSELKQDTPATSITTL